jgi:hypothetical protein
LIEHGDAHSCKSRFFNFAPVDAQVLEMMPGMSQLVAAGGGGANATAKFKKWVLF